MYFKIILVIFLFDFSHAEKQFKVTDQVFFDVEINDKPMGRIVFGLFGEVVPKTVRNFKTIATKGINGQTYAGTKIFRAIDRFMIQGGDIINNDGTGSISIYGDTFPDESFKIKHESSGLISMVNSGPDTNGCQFFITTMATPWLDGKNVVFGKVLKGHSIVHKIEHLKTNSRDFIISDVIITRSGALRTKPFYDKAKNYELTFWEWIKAGFLPLSFSFGILGVFHYIFSQLNKYI